MRALQQDFIIQQEFHFTITEEILYPGMIKGNGFCIPINFANPIKACFSKKKYPVTVKRRKTQIQHIIFLIETPRFNRIYKKYWCSNSNSVQFWSSFSFKFTGTIL